MSLPLLSAKLIELRHQHGYSQQEVADFLGLTREGYSHYERNVREPNLETLLKISHLYNINISELVNEKTILTTKGILENIASSFVSCGMVAGGGVAQGNTVLSIVSTSAIMITKNLNHFLTLFTGKNATVDLTNVTKEDIRVLEQYKKLDKESQKEVREFIKFKYSLKKKK